MSKSRYKRGIGRESKQRIMFKRMFCINANVHLNWPMTSGVVFITTSYLKARPEVEKNTSKLVAVDSRSVEKVFFFLSIRFHTV